MTTTIAQQIASSLTADADGIEVLGSCAHLGCHQHHVMGLDRVEFSDGSALVIDGPAWAVEGADLWSFAND